MLCETTTVEHALRHCHLIEEHGPAINERRIEASHSIADAIPQIVWTALPDGRVDYVNARLIDYSGRPYEELLDFGISRLLHPDDSDATTSRWERSLRARVAFEAEYRLRGADGVYRWHLARATPIFDSAGTIARWLGTCTDIDDRRRLEEQQTFLAEASRELLTSLDIEATLERIARVAVPFFADWTQVDVLDENGMIHTRAAAHRDPSRDRILRALVGGRHMDAAGLDGPARVIRTGAPSVIPAIDAASLATHVRDACAAAVYENVGCASALSVPILSRGATLGALTFVRAAESGRRYAKSDVTFADELARRAGLAYDNAMLFQRERRVADTLQRALLPGSLPRVEGWTFDASYTTADREAEIGGDWYDAFALDDHRIAISIGDVSGHGLRAAVIMNVVRQAFRSAALEGYSPADVFTRANRVLRMGESAVVTAIFGILDTERSTLTYAVAGHPSPLLVCGEAARWLGDHGIPLGLDEEYGGWENQVDTLPGGSLLVMYTDGIIEYARDVFAGEERLAEAACRYLATAASSPARFVQRHVFNGIVPKDDAAVLTVQIGSAIDHLNITLDATPFSSTVARTVLRKFIASTPLDDDAAFALTLAAGEAVINAIEHAYVGNEGTFALRGYRDGSEIVVEIEDGGLWRASANQADRGRGITLMRALTDRCEIRRDGAGTRLTVAKRLPGAALAS